MEHRRRRWGRRLLALALGVAMAAGQLPAEPVASIAGALGVAPRVAYAGTETTYDPASDYTDYGTLISNDTTVTIEDVQYGNPADDVDWYVIGYDGSAKTVTLLSKQTLGYSSFNDEGMGTEYSGSVIEGYVKGLMADGQPLAAIKGALADVSVTDPDVSGAVPYVLSAAEANDSSTMSEAKRKGTGDYWWLRSPGESGGYGAYVEGEGAIVNTGDIKERLGVRPALKLDLSKVAFDSGSKTFAMKPVATVKASGAEEATGYSDFAAAVAAWKQAGAGAVLKLKADVTTTAPIVVTNGTEDAPMTLDLNDHGILMTGDGSVINEQDGFLDLIDSADPEQKTTRYLTLDEDGRAISVSSDPSEGALAVSGGYISGGEPCGVYLYGGMVNMSGGTIAGNVSGGGGGVIIYGGTFNMAGGTITGNMAAANGGGVAIYWSGSVFNMSGGTITGNMAATDGGGVTNLSGGEFNMTGGEISGNTATSGGGVCVKPGATFNVSGTAKVSGNTAGTGGSANNVHLSYSESPGAQLSIGTNGLSQGASIGVTMDKPGTFTKGSTVDHKAITYKDYFFSDDAAYSVVEDGNELKLGYAPVEYLKWDETQKKLVEQTGDDACKTYELVASSESEGDVTWGTDGQESWYVVKGPDPVSIAGTVRVYGDVHLILCDGAKLEAEKGIAGISTDVSLTIHGQSGERPGKLIATSTSDSYPSIDDLKTIVLNGGDLECKAVPEKIPGLAARGIVINGGKVKISADAGTSTDQYVVSTSDSFTINGGDIDIEGVKNGIATNALTVNDGTVGIEATDRAAIANCIVLNGGKIDIKGGTSYGIEAFGDEGITIGENMGKNDGHVIVSGGKGALSGTVKNAVPGMGWTDTQGKQGKAAIEAKPEGQTLDATYKRAQFPAPAAEVTKAPKAARGLVADGSAHALVTAGAAEGGTMAYALGANAETAPADGWSDKVPTGSEAGTYHVWYKAVGNESHTDSEPACVEASIATKPEPATLGKARLHTVAHPAKGSIDASWKAVSGAKSYELQWRAAGGKWKTAKVKGTSKAVTGLKRGGAYELRVRAVSGSRKGAWSNASRRWLQGVSGIKAASKKAGSVKVSWKASKKATAGYEVLIRYEKGGKVVARKAVKAGKSSVTIKGLKSGKTAYVQVRPLRSKGGKTFKGTINATPKKAKIK